MQRSRTCLRSPVSYTHLDVYKRQKERFLAYSLEFQEVLIGTPKPQPGDTQIEYIMAQLRDRQIARCLLYTSRCV